MTEQELDRVLAEALTAEPSPDFVARVRTQVAAEAAPGRWNRWWPAAVAGVAAVALSVGGGLQSNDGAAPQPVRIGVVASGEEPATSTASTRASTSVAQPRRVVPRSSPRSFPEVLISPDDAGAVRLLLASAHDGMSPSPADDLTEPLMVTQIALPPIQVAPLAELTQLERGERQ